MSTPILITFIVYFIILLAIGLYFYRKSTRIEDYLLGGRQMGPQWDEQIMADFEQVANETKVYLKKKN
jgi:hypothetical protein